MSASEIDLIERAVALAEAEYLPGVNHTRYRKKLLPGFHYQQSRRWTAEEYQFLRDNLYRMSVEEIAAGLRRSVSAVRIKIVRRCMTRPSKRKGWLTGNRAAHALGVDIHSIVKMHERGLMPFEVMPGQYGYLLITKLRLYMWAVNPEHWIYFRVDNMGDEKLQRLVRLAQSRWQDEWLTPGQAGELLDADCSTINSRIHKRQIRASRWGNWWIRRSEIEGLVIHRRKGMPGVSKKFTPAADAFILRAHAAGVGWAAIGRMMKMDDRAVYSRWRVFLKERNDN